MKRILLVVAAVLLASGALIDRPVHACPIGYNPGTCNSSQCHDSCVAQGGSGGTCVFAACKVTCNCRFLP